jgi:effector-binding domain-containing protein
MSEPESIEATRIDSASMASVQLDCRCGPDPATISEAMGRAFETLGRFMGANGLAPGGPPRAIYNAYSPEGVDVTVAFPIRTPAAPIPAGGDVRVALLPGGRTLRFTHTGPYRDLAATYGRITRYLIEAGLMENEEGWAQFMPMWEEYVNDPQTTAEAELVTHIHLPLV